MDTYIAALDQGTTSSRAILFHETGEIAARAQYPFRQIYPQPGWVEHDPMEIWASERRALAEITSHIDPRQVAAIGITNQRETTILWDRRTGEPIHNAIVWQCRRTAPFCDELKARGLGEIIAEKTGLLIDAYFSASKIRWLLDHVPGARERAERGEQHPHPPLGRGALRDLRHPPEHPAPAGGEQRGLWPGGPGPSRAGGPRGHPHLRQHR